MSKITRQKVRAVLIKAGFAVDNKWGHIAVREDCDGIYAHVFADRIEYNKEFKELYDFLESKFEIKIQKHETRVTYIYVVGDKK